MDFLDIEGATEWGDGSNEKLHCALFSASLPMKKKKKKKKTTAESVDHVSGQKSMELDGQKTALKLQKKRKEKSYIKKDADKLVETSPEVHPSKAKRKYVEKEEVGGHNQSSDQLHPQKARRKHNDKGDKSFDDQTHFQIHSQKGKRNFFEKEGVPIVGKEQALFQMLTKKAKRKSNGKGFDAKETPETKVQVNSLGEDDKDEWNHSNKRFRMTDALNEDNELGRNSVRARSIFRDEGQDVEHPKRKKRKRKPRNNKFEGWTKKGTDQESEKGNVVEERSLKAKDVGNNCKDVDDEIDLCHDKMMQGGTDCDGKESFKVNQKVEGHVQEKNERIVKDKRKGKLRKDDKGADEHTQESKIRIDENCNSNITSKNEAKYRNEVSESMQKEYEETLQKNEQNFEDKQHQDGSQIIYAENKKRHKSKGVLGSSAWENQLRSARFRFINETLYKSSGAEAFKTFKGDRASFEVYHEGYSQQVQQWPENPVDIIIKYLKKRPQSWIIGDFGCGEAKIAQSVRQKVLSFDIFRANEDVTVCNISKVPLRTDSLDVAVYCLSLMGSNWPDYLREGNRVLKKGGLLKIAEVASRFKSVDSFISLLDKLGFTLKGKDLTNKMFYMFDFEKKKNCGQIPDKAASILKPCMYKRR